MSLRPIGRNDVQILPVGLLLCAGLYLTSLYSYLLFHIVAEGFSIVIAVSLFMIAWNTRQLTTNNYVLFLSIAFLCAGLIDFVHTLAYKGMGIFTGYDANLPTQLWIAARYLQSLSLLAAPWFIDRKLNIRATVAFYLSGTILLLTIVFSGTLFPVCFVEGHGLTLFKIVSEYIICFILISSLVVLVHYRDTFDPPILRLIVWSILFTIASEMAFTFYVSVYGLSNLIGHYCKILAFYLIYRAIIVAGLKNPYRLIFHDLQRSREELQVIMDASPMMIFYKDRENRFIRVNKTLAEVTRLPKEGIEGKDASEVYPRQATSYLKDDREVIASGTAKKGIIEPIHSAIGTRWLQTDKVPYRDVDGNIIGIIGFSIDITERKQKDEELKESESRMRAITHSAQDAILMMDPEGRISYWNPAAERILGYTSAEAIGQNLHQLIAPLRYHEAHRAAFPVFQQKGQGAAVGKTLDLEAIRKDGKEISVQLSLSGIHMKGAWHAVGVLRDVTEQKEVDDKLRESEELLTSSLENAPEGIYMSDLEGNFLYGNRMCEEIVGYRREELIGKNFLELNLLSENSLNEASRLLQANMEDKSTGPDELELITKEGRLIPVEINTSVVQRMGQKIVLAFVRDITERKQAEERIRQMAYHDSLTGLPNRKLFSDRLGIALTQARRNKKGVGIAMLDLDNFKGVNDTLGHAAGDLLLQKVAKRLSAALRKGDTVARIGGDEFVLILPDLKATEDAITVAQKIVDSSRKPFLIDTHQLVVTTSIGIAVSPDDGTDEGVLLKNADIAMYQAKQAGRNRYQSYKHQT